ncbi:MAG: hypothetical protein O2820_20800 [Planctomycetota bacterium]|nr:hypothetical protein [Planctomycetota bacterium]MDA1251657.1 hypothetical protein [Planctomycetota bacterium]
MTDSPEKRPEKAPLESAPTRQEIELETENLVATYDTVAEWIRFADAKAAVVLTVVGAIAGTLIPTLRDYLASADPHPTTWWNTLVTVLFAGWLSLGVAASVFAFRCIIPFRRKGHHPALEKCAHFHPAGIASKYTIDQHDEFVAGYQQAGTDGFRKEVLAGLLID